MTAPIPSRTVEMDWGTLVMTPPDQPGEPMDFCFDFRPTLTARREAFGFAKVMHEELSKSLVQAKIDAHIEFVSADDHYHLLVIDRAFAQAKIALNMMPAISHGAISGRGTQGRALSATITGRHRVVEVEAEE